MLTTGQTLNVPPAGSPTAFLIGVGQSAAGSLTVNNGSLVETTGSFLIGNQSGGNGSVTVTGTGSVLNVGSGGGSNINIGTPAGASSPGSGTLTVQNGGSVLVRGAAAQDAFVGIGRSGTVTVRVESGGSLQVLAGASLTINNRLAGTSTNLNHGATLNVGPDATGDGTLVLDGTGSSVTLSGFNALVNVGRTTGATGTATVSGGAVLNSAAMNVGRDGGVGSVTVTGTGSRINLTTERGALSTPTATGGLALQNEAGFLGIGRGTNGRGTMNILAGASVVVAPGSTQNTGSTGAGVTLGRDATSTGTLTLDSGTLTINSPNAANTSLGQFDGFLFVGRTGTGTLTAQNGSTVTGTGPNFTAAVGRDSGSVGTVTVAGGSTMTVTGSRAGMQIAQSSGSTGTVTVTGAGSRITVNGNDAFVDVGNGGTATLNIMDGGIVTAQDLGSGGTNPTLSFNLATSVVTSSTGSIPSVAISSNGTATGTVTLSGSGSELQAPGIAVGADVDGDGDQIGLNASGTGTGTLSVGSGTTVRSQVIAIGQRGTLIGSGTVIGDLFSVGRVRPGSSPGTLTINGNFLQGAGGTLELEIAGRAAGQFDQLVVTGSAAFTGGTIQFSFLENFQPAAGDAFPLIVAGNGVTVSDSTTLSFSGLSSDFFTGLRTFTFENGTLMIVEPAQEQATAIQETSETQVRTSATVATVAVATRLRNLLTGFGPMKGGFSQPAGSQIVPTGTSGGDEPATPAWLQNVGVWADGDYGRIDDETPNQRFVAGVYNTLFGLDVILGGRFVVGGGFGVEIAKVDFRSDPGSRDSDTYSAIGYAAYRLTEVFTIAGQVGYGLSESDIDQVQAGVRTTGEFGSKRMLAGVQLLANRSYGDFELTGTAGFTHARETFENYTASNGGIVAPDSTKVGLLRIGGEVAHYWDSVGPYLGFAYDYDVQAGDRNDSTGNSKDPSGIEVEAGVRVQLGDQLTGGVSARRSFSRAYEASYGAAVNLRYQF